MKSFNLDTTVTVCGNTPQLPINVSNSDDSYIVDTLVDLELPNINVTDSDGTVTSVPSVQDVTCTPPSAIRVSNSDDSYDVNTLVDLELPNSTISNSNNTYSQLVPATENLGLPNINVTDSDGTVTSVPSMENITCTPPSAIRVSNSDDSYDVNTLVDLELPNSTISNSNNSYSQLVPATENLGLPNINFTDSDGTVTSVPSMENITATAAGSIRVSNSDDSYDVNTSVDLELPNTSISNSNNSYFQLVPATENLGLPNINFTDSDGTVSSVPSMEDITATAGTASIRVSNSNDSYDVNTSVDLELPNSTVSNANDSYVQLVPATENLELPLENLTVEDTNGVVSQTLTNSPYKDIIINVSASAPVIDKLFKMTINTTGSFTFPFHNTQTRATVNWGDGSSDLILAFNQSDLTHVYAAAGVYQISVEGQFGGCRFNNGGSKLELTSVDNWGTALLSNIASAFRGCTNMTGTYTDSPNILVVIDGGSMFENCTSFNQPLTFNTTKINNMQSLLRGCSSFNSLLTFDTSTVTSMRLMFNNCTVFNKPLNFDTSNVISLQHCLSNCTAFNQDLSGFNISSLTDAGNMLQNTAFDTTNYDLLLISWAAQTHNNNVPFHAGTAQYSFGAATTSRDVLIADGWIIQDGGQGAYIFSGKSDLQTAVNLWISNNALAITTYGQINTWNTSAVNDMSGIFNAKATFNDDISNWDTSNVTNMTIMFSGASVFNQPLNSWDVSSVTNMTGMFAVASAFNQPINSWNVSNVTNMSFMLNNATSYSKVNYDLLLVSWAALSLQSNVTFAMNSATEYSTGAATTARGVLTSAPNNWTITDGGQSAAPTDELIGEQDLTASAWDRHTGNGTFIGSNSWTLAQRTTTASTDSDGYAMYSVTDSSTSNSGQIGWQTCGILLTDAEMPINSTKTLTMEVLKSSLVKPFQIMASDQNVQFQSSGWLELTTTGVFTKEGSGSQLTNPVVTSLTNTYRLQFSITRATAAMYIQYFPVLRQTDGGAFSKTSIGSVSASPLRVKV